MFFLFFYFFGFLLVALKKETEQLTADLRTAWFVSTDVTEPQNPQGTFEGNQTFNLLNSESSHLQSAPHGLFKWTHFILNLTD